MTMSLQAACTFFLLAILLNMRVKISNAEVKDTTRTSEQDAKFPEVTIPQGTLQGIHLVTRYNRSISSFLGIPYALPPVGNLRFRSPVAASAWNGKWNASVDGNTCLQPGNIGKEDCLYLNVHTPQLPETDRPSLLPVIVLIPGGGFEAGNGDSSAWGPGYLLDADVVLVSINYRLGPLGFLSTGDEVAPGNWGLKDQVLALQWVQNNIAYFGGDPDRVTLCGHSAGGASVQLLALSESTTGLFHKHISQSGAAFGFWPHQPRSSQAKLALRLGEILGCPTSTSSLLIDCLRELDASEIVETRSQLSKWNHYPLVLWGPTDEPDIEGALLTDIPANLLAAGKLRDVPSITGLVKNEGSTFVPGAGTFEELLKNFDHLLPIALQYSDRVEDVSRFTAALKDFYYNDDFTSNRAQLWSNIAELYSDALFIFPIYKALQMQLASAENTPFFYSFEYQGTHSNGARHCDNDLTSTCSLSHGEELLYLFPKMESEMSETDLKMIDTMVQLWTSFAINGTPTTNTHDITWMPYSLEDNYLRIGSGSDGKPELRYNFLRERMQFWDGLVTTGSRTTATVSQFRESIFVFLMTYSTIFGKIYRYGYGVLNP